MKITLTQQNYKVGDFSYNLGIMQHAVTRAIAQGSDLVVFGELSLCGYAHYDDIFYASFVQRMEQSLAQVAEWSKDIAIICGGFRRYPLTNGRKFINTAFVFQQGRLQHSIDKTLLPYFDIFEEEKYFERGSNNLFPIEIANKRIILSVCADMWAFHTQNNYITNPIRAIAETYKADMIINISASPYDYLKLHNRTLVIQNICSTYHIPFFYCNLVGAYDETIFDGQSLVHDSDGRCVVKMKSFEEDLQTIDLDKLSTFSHLSHKSAVVSPHRESVISFLQDEIYITEILAALQFSLKEFLRYNNCQRIVIASSGGIDSAVCLAITSQVFPKENILSLGLPTRFNSSSTQQDASQLAVHLGVEHIEIGIDNIFNHYLELLKQNYRPSLQSLTEENLQSRIRSTLAMALANDAQALVINTSNKSELATGYGTLYGDMAGAISLLGDIFKTQVYSLAKLLIQQGIPIPSSIVERAPSAELRANQQDIDSLPDYSLLDSILYFFIHKNEDMSALLHRGFPEQEVRCVLSLFKKSQFKRKQFCPIVRISDKAFGQGKKHLITSSYCFE